MGLNIKGGYTWRNAKKIYITSNIEPTMWYPNCPPIHRKALFRRFTSHKIMNQRHQLDQETHNNMSIQHEQLYLLKELDDTDEYKV